MRQFILATVLLGSIAVVRAANDFDSMFSSYKKGDSAELKWKDFGNTDLVKLNLITKDGKSRVSVPLSSCAETGKTGVAPCSRFINTGKYKIDPSLPEFSSVVVGTTYYFEIDYIERGPGTKTGTSQSRKFTVEAASTKSSSGSSKTKSKKKGKGKLGVGGIAGIAVGVAVIFLILAGYAIKARCCKGRNKDSASKGLEEDHEMGKQADDPLMGQDGRVKNTTVWSADIPDDHSRPVEEVLPKYEPYKPTTTGQGAAADYYNEPIVKPTGNGAGPMGNDRY